MKHNRSLRRKLGVLFGLVLCLTLLTVSALAAEPATETADFATDAEAALALLRNGDDSTADWDGDQKILTLNGVNFSTSAAIAVKLPDGATIVLADDTTNTITSIYSGREMRSGGIYVEGGLTIQGSGTLTVKGGTMTGTTAMSCGIFVFGYYDSSSWTYVSGRLTISGGHVIARTLAGENGKALNVEPVLSGYTDCHWRTSTEDLFTAYTPESYTDDPAPTYVEFSNGSTYTVTFAPNDGSGEMAAVNGVSGIYTLPACDFTAPERQRFKAWRVNGTEYAVGADITVSADTTVTAVWEITYTVTAYGCYGGTYTGNETIIATNAAGDIVALPIGARDGYTLKDLRLDGISEDELSWNTKEEGEDHRQALFTMPANDVTVTVNWERIGGGSTGGGSTPTYTPTVPQPENGAVTVNPKAPKNGDTVTITPKPEAGYTVEQILVTDKNGNPVEVTNNGDGTFSFTQPAGKVTVEVTFMDDNTMLNSFVDVPADAYYYEAVLWAARNGITVGVDDTHFAPDDPCTRAQIVTFLWRAAGCPEPENVSSFADVSADSYYAKAVAWAVEQGYVKGTTDTTFSPDAICTRAKTMTLLWRAQNSPAAGTANPFTDVAADAYYADAVQWASESGITDGTTDTTFSPGSDCTRG